MNFKLVRRFSIFIFIIAALSAAAPAQQPARITPSADRLRETVTYLASDALEGRRTGTAGANDAAHYIAGEFQRLGMKPGFPLARRTRLRGELLAQYEQKFPYVAGVELGKNNLFFLKPQRSEDAMQFRVAEDWLPLGFSSNANLNAGIVFAGYGISSAELKYDDYAVASVKDQVAVVFDGTPDGDNPHGQFARAGEVRFKVAAARAAGARALLIIASEQNLKDDRLARLSYDNAGEAGISVIVISRTLAAKILRSTSNLTDYEQIADSRKLKPSGNGNADDPNISQTNTARQPIGGVTLSLTTEVVRREVPAANVVGILEGTDPQLKKEAIVLGAHYDHLGRGGEGSLAPREGEIHHGADDNASGVAGLLELARIFSVQKPRRTMIFIAFSGEEEGLLGSNYYVNHPVVPVANTAAMFNMDMIGRMKDGKLIVGGIGTAQNWRSMVETANVLQGVTVAANEAAPAEGSAGGNSRPISYPMVVGTNGTAGVSSDPAKRFQLSLSEDGYGPSDHSSFYSKQVPVLFFWTGTHEDYHKPSDTADKINYADEARVVAFVAGLLRDVDQSDKRPAYTVAKSDATGRASGFRVYLGTIPNYADSNDGLLLDGVRDDSPAAKAGLKAGDKIVKLAGRDVRNVYDYTYALGEMKAGQEYEVEVMRGGERFKLKLTPAARK